MDKEFTVLTISREFLGSCGIDASKFTDDEMERIAGKLADSFLQNIEEELADAI